MMTGRRAVLGGIAAAAILPGRARAADTLRAALDRAAESPPDAALRMLAGFDAAALTGPARADLDAARAGLAIDAMPDAADPRARYARLLRRIGAGLSPGAADARLAAEQARVERRAAALFARIGDRAGPVGLRYTRLWRDPRFLFPDDEAGRDAAVAAMNATLARIRRDLPALMPAVPPWCLDVAVRRMTAAEDAADRMGYRVAPTPFAPGAYAVELRRIRDRPVWSLPGVVAHELLPGHMIQTGMEDFTRPHTLRFRYAAGFAEGWAIFAEALAAARGWIGDDPRTMLGHLHWLLFRIVRARADLALHWHGRPRAAVGAAMAAALGEPAYFTGFDADLDRLTAQPGLRVADATAWLALADRAAARRPGALPDWLDRVLRDGRRRDADLPR